MSDKIETRPPAGELFADAGARAVWAAIVHLDEATKHRLLAVLAEHLAVPEDRVDPHRARTARAIAALREAAKLADDGLSRDAYDELRRRNPGAGWPGSSSVCRWLGGTWNDGLREAGLSEVFDGDAVVRELGPAFTREECVQAVLDYVADTGDQLPGCHAVIAWAKRSDVRARSGHRPRSLGPYQRLFAGWTEVLAACGLIDANAPTGAAVGTTGYGSVRPAKAYGYTEEQLFAAMREVADRLARSPKTQEYIREREKILAEEGAAGRLPRAFPTYNVIQTRFPTWDEALSAAGLEPVRGRYGGPRPIRERRTRRIDDEVMLAAIREAFAMVGEPFTSTAYTNWRAEQRKRDRAERRVRTIPSYVAMWQRWGSWVAARDKALGR